MAEENLSTGGDNEIEYIPFYGELRMTTFTTEDRKAATKKTKKEKVTIVADEAKVEQAIVQEIVTARTEGVVKEFSETKAAIIGKTLEELETKATPQEAVRVAEKMVEALKDEIEEKDVPEPGVVDVALSRDDVDVTRRGFNTIHMARAHRDSLQNSQNYLIVEVRDARGPVLAYYVIHKAEEL